MTGAADGAGAGEAASKARAEEERGNVGKGGRSLATWHADICSYRRLPFMEGLFSSRFTAVGVVDSAWQARSAGTLLPSALCITQKRRSETELRDCAGAADSGPPTCSQRIIFLTHSRRCISSLSHTNTTMQFLGANDAMCALLMPHLGLQVFLPNPRKLAALSVSVSGPQSHSRTRTASVPVLLFSVLIPVAVALSGPPRTLH